MAKKKTKGPSPGETYKHMKILAMDTSADETSAAITNDLEIVSNIVWSQASLHAKWGGVVPSLAQRAHKERIDWVIAKALGRRNIDAVAATVGPGLAIALGVGIEKAKELAKKHKKPLIAVNHVEGHLLSSLLKLKEKVSFPSFGLVISGKNTQLVYIEKIGKYKVLAETRDDALGEALDKGGRMLGLGYPAGAIVEKLAKEGDFKKFPLPIPLLGREKEHFFTYSGIKAAMYRTIANTKLTKENIQSLASSFQDSCFKHLTRVVKQTILDFEKPEAKYLLIGGGVSANMELRKRLRKIGKELNLKVLFPYNKRLCGDNAAMIGIAAFFKSQREEFVENIDKVDRIPNAKIDEEFSF